LKGNGVDARTQVDDAVLAVPSVVTTLIFSMRAGLLASTVTPGSTLPLASVTRPAMLPVCCASASSGSHADPVRRRKMTRMSLTSLVTAEPPLLSEGARVRAAAEHSITAREAWAFTYTESAL
jgi:hypothetical protein